LKKQLLQNTQAAHERGPCGSPTFFVKGKICCGKDRLFEVDWEALRPKA
jgi:2-hydroxychromene-2-carboxylate isomerase